MGKRLLYVLYAILYSFIIIPIIGLLSIKGYNFFVTKLFEDNFIAELAYVMIAVIIVIIAIYMLVIVFNDKLKVPLIYHIVTGILATVISLWLIVYFKTISSSICNIAIYGEGISNCTLAILGSKTFIAYLVYAIACYTIYIVVAKWNTKKDIKKNKKKQK